MVLAVALAACGSPGGAAPGPAASSGAPPSRPSAVASPSPLSPVDLAGQQAVEAYLGMWRATAEASHTSDWQAPELARYASGEALQVVTGALYADHLNGVVSRGEPVDMPTVTSLDPEEDPTTVLISDCGDSTNWLKYRADTGQLVEGSPGGRRHITAEVKLHEDGVWRVTGFAVRSVGSC